LFINFEPDPDSLVIYEPSAILPIVSYGDSLKTSRRFPIYLEVSAQKIVRESRMNSFIEQYKSYIKRRIQIDSETEQLSSFGFSFEHIEKVDGTIQLWCTYDADVKTPPILVTLPCNYPLVSPVSDLEFEDDLLPDVKRVFQYKMRTVNQLPYSLVTMLTQFKESVQEVLT